MTEKSDKIDGQNEIKLNDYCNRSGGRIYCNITNWSRTVNRAKLGNSRVRNVANSAQFAITDFRSALHSVIHMKIWDWSTKNRFIEKDWCRIDCNSWNYLPLQKLNVPYQTYQPTAPSPYNR